jgi:UDP-glucose 4-epimerase
MNLKRIIITGPLGHIGSEFIRNLKPESFSEVILFDNFLTQRYCSLFNLPTNVPFRFIEGDIRNFNFIELLKDIDLVIHFAAITDAANSFDSAELVNEVNYTATICLANACIANNCKLLYFSTTSVYGVSSDLVDENCDESMLKPQSPYAKSKLNAEKHLYKMGKEEGLKCTILRLGTIYGTSIGMRFHTAVNKFCFQAVIGQPLTVWRTAINQKRPYLSLNEAISAILFIIENDHFKNQLYNVVTSNSTVNEILTCIREFIPDISITEVDTQIMNQLSYEVSNQKIKALGFEFNGELRNGISDTIHLLKGVNQFHAK